MKCAQGAFVLLNSPECAYWDGAIFERRGKVSFARDTLQSRWWVHAIWRILRVVMSLVSLFYEMSSGFHVTREWMVNKLTVKLILMQWILTSDMDCYYSKFYPRREYLFTSICQTNKQTNSLNISNAFPAFSRV